MTICSTCEGNKTIHNDTAFYRAARVPGMDFKFASWTKIEDAKDECKSAEWLSEDDRVAVEQDEEECYIVTLYDECPMCHGTGNKTFLKAIVTDRGPSFSFDRYFAEMRLPDGEIRSSFFTTAPEANRWLLRAVDMFNRLGADPGEEIKENEIRLAYECGVEEVEENRNIRS